MWLLIIAFVLRFIVENLDSSEAVSKACSKYGVLSSDILDRL